MVQAATERTLADYSLRKMHNQIDKAGKEMTQLTHALNTILKRFGAHRVEIQQMDCDYFVLLINGWREVSVEYFDDGSRRIEVKQDDEWIVDKAYADWLGAIIDGYVRNDSGHMVPSSRQSLANPAQHAG